MASSKCQQRFCPNSRDVLHIVISDTNLNKGQGRDALWWFSKSFLQGWETGVPGSEAHCLFLESKKKVWRRKLNGKKDGAGPCPDPEGRREVRAWLTAAPTPLITELQVLRQEDPTDWRAGHTPTWLDSRFETRLVFRFSEADRICEVQQVSHRAELHQIFSGTILLMTCLSLFFYPLHLRSDEQNIQT